MTDKRHELSQADIVPFDKFVDGEDFAREAEEASQEAAQRAAARAEATRTADPGAATPVPRPHYEQSAADDKSNPAENRSDESAIEISPADSIDVAGTPDESSEQERARSVIAEILGNVVTQTSLLYTELAGSDPVSAAMLGNIYRSLQEVGWASEVLGVKPLSVTPLPQENGVNDAPGSGLNLD